MSYLIFRRTWRADARCTIPHAGRKYYSGQRADSEQEARRICHQNNAEDFGAPNGRGARGAAWEYESG